MRALAGLLLLASPLVLVELRRALPFVLGLDEVAPDPVLVAIAFAALRKSPTAACVVAAACGFLLDVTSGSAFGLEAARLSFVAAVLASVRQDLDAQVGVVRVAAVLGAALFERALAATFLELGSPEVPFFELLGRGLISACATAAAAPFLWPACEAVATAAGPRRRERMR
jgi:rod shape-determining protein MreD